MKIGDAVWLSRERDWLEGDVEYYIGLVKRLEKRNWNTPEFLESQRVILAGKRKELTLLRSNPREYVRKIKANVSRLSARD